VHESWQPAALNATAKTTGLGIIQSCPCLWTVEIRWRWPLSFSRIILPLPVYGSAAEVDRVQEQGLHVWRQRVQGFDQVIAHESHINASMGKIG
jgi:hypothetical protein